MKIANNIKISVFAKEDEDIESIRQGFFSLFPFDPAEQKISISEKNATGFNEKKIKVIEALIEKDRHCNEFLRGLLNNLSEDDKKKLLRQTDSRVDEDCNFFIRLDKGKAIAGECSVTESGVCYHIKINIASFPKKKDNAMKALIGFIEGIDNAGTGHRELKA